jgi:hypothetical protein
MERIVKKILEHITYAPQDAILFDNAKLGINKESFNDIKLKISQDTIAFIDGGNLEILKTPSLSLFFNRVYGCTFQNNTKVKNSIFEFYTLISTFNKEARLFYKTEYLFTNNKFNLKEYEFDSSDELIAVGNQRAPISLIGNIIRRFAELITAANTTADIVIIDGDLDIKYPYEEELHKDFANNIGIICGLAKTSNILTYHGNTATAYLDKLSGRDMWLYNTGRNSPHTYFVKLCKSSKYIFRLDVIGHKQDINTIANLLIANSKDPIFPGYPYGLVEADKLARVSKSEQESLKLQLMARFGKDYMKIIPFINSQNAHDILDSIS